MSFKPAKWWPFLSVTIALLSLLALIPFHSAIALGGDEGMELSKGLLLCRHAGLVVNMWNDQPLAYSVLLSHLFAVFNPEAWVPRVVTLLTTGLVLFSIITMLPRQAGAVAQVSCLLFFLTWQAVPELSMSAMCELPAQALAVASAAMLCKERRPVGAWECAFSGLLFANALLVKLTAAIVFPALVAGAVVSGVCRVRLWSIWLVCAATWFAFSVSLLPAWSWDMVWNSHFEAKAGMDPSTVVQYRYPWSSLLETPAPVLATIVALSLVIKRRSWGGGVVFPLVLLATAASVHAFHRPWWWYYQVHFAIPFSMLGGIGCGALWRAAVRPSEGMPHGFSSDRGIMGSGFAATAGSAVLALWVSFQLSYFCNEVKRMRGELKGEDHALLATVRQYTTRTRWAFARGPGLNYAFHEGLLIPPELIVLSKKRFWAGHLTEADVLGHVSRYQPELLFLPKQTEQVLPGWERFLAEHYTFVHEHPLVLLFVHNRLAPARPVTATEVVRQLGL